MRTHPGIESLTMAAARRRFAGSIEVWIRPTSVAATPGRPRRNPSPRAHSAGDESHGLGASSSVAQLAACRAGDGFRAWLAYAAHGHAEVLALDDHNHPARLQDVVDRIGDLGGESFLHLRSLGVDINEAGELAEPGDLPV